MTKISYFAYFRDAEFAPEMVVIPHGKFLMGSCESEEGRRLSEGPQHHVTLGDPYAMGRYAVTFEEWDYAADHGLLDGYKPESHGWGRGNFPVINVDHQEATAYTVWLSEVTQEQYMLPSEAQWEYAARAGSLLPYWWGSFIYENQANFGRRYDQPVPVDHFHPNPWGLYNVHGNVWEWCQDHWHETYHGAPNDGFSWLEPGSSSHVLRGGSWSNTARYLRSAQRIKAAWDLKRDNIGFRVCRAWKP